MHQKYDIILIMFFYRFWSDFRLLLGTFWEPLGGSWAPLGGSWAHLEGGFGHL